MPPRNQASQRQRLRQRNDWPTRAVILAAGRGKRLAPYTNNLPKPLLETDGQPMLGSIFKALNAAMVSEVCVVIHHFEEKIIAFAGGGLKWGLKIEYRRQESLLGTANGLMAASSFLSEPTFVLAADYTLPHDYLRTLKGRYQESHADLFASFKKMSSREIAKRNSVRIDEQGNVVEIIEKPATGAITCAGGVGASLIYVVPPEIAAYLPRIKLSQRGEFEITDALNLMLADGFRMAGIFQQPLREWQPPHPGSLTGSGGANNR